MELIVLGSGSTGNCYLLTNDKECLVIEAGISLMDVKIELDFNISKIVGVISTHSHADHNKYINDYKKIGIKTFTPFNDESKSMMKCFGNFTINAFPLNDKNGNWCHSNSDETDCECYGFFIQHPEITNMVYVTDCSFVRWNFKKHNVHHFLVECNYSDEFINIDGANKNHVINGHMSLDTCKDFIKANSNTHLETITLCHLSTGNADKNVFRDEIQSIVYANVDVAERGKVIELNPLPF